MDDPLKVHLLIRNRVKIFFDEDVKSVTSVNDMGIFDILPQHANFITLIKRYVIVHKLDGTVQKKEINNGVMKIRGNLINCYIDILPPMLDNTQPQAAITKTA